MDETPLVNRLLSGVVIFRLRGQYIYVRPAKAEDKAFADVYAQEFYEDCLLEGMLTQKDLQDFAIESGWWNEEQDEKLKKLDENLEQMKLDYYNNFFKEDTRKYIKNNIDSLDKKILDLWNEKHLFFDKSCEYLRDYAKGLFIFKRCAFINDKVIDDNFVPYNILYNSYLGQMLPDKKIRAAVKSPEWRIVWGSSKDVGALFDIASCDLTQEQLSAVSWSKFYDGINESVERPPDEIIKDDLAIDGWSVSQDRKRKEEEKRSQGEKLLSDNMGDAGEVFVPVKSQREQDQILSLNDSYGKSVLKSKKKQFEKGGTFSESDLNHVKKEIQMEGLRQAKESRR